jgi:GNAT superfamily N-acetyltransferase
MDELDNKSVIRTKQSSYSYEIYEIIQELLLSPAELNENDEDTNQILSQKGFVIGDHTVEQLKSWISNSLNHIYIKQDAIRETIIGFVLILNTNEIKKQVQKYGIDTQFIRDQTAELFKSKEFSYLIQIGVKPSHQNKGIASSIIQTAYKMISLPIISFVMISPIVNYPSLYFHIKNGFQYEGNYLGGYGGFPNYVSACLIHYPQSKIPSKPKLEKSIGKILKTPR